MTTNQTEGQHAGEFILEELGSPDFCRIRNATVTVPSGGLPAGSVLGIVTSSGKYVQYDNAETDGRETAAGILYDSFSDAEAGDQANAVVLVRMARVRRDDLQYKTGTSSGNKTAAEVELATSYVIVTD